MSALLRPFTPWFASALLSPRTRDLARGWAELQRRAAGRPHTIAWFHQVDDPYSHLLAQVMPRLAAAFDVEVQPFLVGPPPDEAAPDRERLVGFARKDAADIAPAWGLRFERSWAQPSPQAVASANAVLAGALAEGCFVERAAAVGEELWAGRLEAEPSDPEPGSVQRAAAALAEGDRRRRTGGHYLGAMLRYGGEWFWGVDRLDLLEDRLEDRRSGPRLFTRPVEGDMAATPTRGLVLEAFVSARSPYSYLALQRTLDLAQRHGLALRLRPVLPMVSRGLAVPRAKRLYILRDCKREADRLGLPFGHISDPLGRPLERMFSLYPWARDQGRHADLLLAFTRLHWSQGVDGGTDSGLRHIVEAAGLDWTDARPHLDSDTWRAELEDNRQALLDMGLWGVPSFRLRGAGPDFVTWGQDRLWRVEREVRRRG